MKNFENLRVAIDAAVNAKNAYEERLKRNDSEWEQFSSCVKEAWNSLGLIPVILRGGSTLIKCSSSGIEIKSPDSEKTPQDLYELTNRVIKYLDVVRSNYDSKFVEG